MPSAVKRKKMSIVDTVLHKIFGTPHERKVKQLRPVIEQLHDGGVRLILLRCAENQHISTEELIN